MELIEGLVGLRAAVGREIGPSDWLMISQDSINEFARLTGDDQWIHVDLERARRGPYGATVAHGHLTLSMLPQLLNMLRRIDGVTMGVNYGLGKVRFPNPVRGDTRIRGRATITDVSEVSGTTVQVTTVVTIESEGLDKPCCVAEQLARYKF